MRKESVYAVYKGDKFIDLGTKKELAKRLNVKIGTVSAWANLRQRKRIENTQKKDGYIAIKIEDED